MRLRATETVNLERLVRLVKEEGYGIWWSKAKIPKMRAKGNLRYNVPQKGSNLSPLSIAWHPRNVPSSRGLSAPCCMSVGRCPSGSTAPVFGSCLAMMPNLLWAARCHIVGRFANLDMPRHPPTHPTPHWNVGDGRKHVGATCREGVVL